MLTKIKSYLRDHKTANLFELKNLLQIDPTVIEDMLQHWIRKGRVRKCPKLAECGSKCNKCSPLLTEIYEWVG